MALVPFVAPPPPPKAATMWPPPVTGVSQLPVAKRMSRKRFWPMMLGFIALCLFFEPVRLLGVMLFFFWVVAIGVMPHVALMKVMTGNHRD